MKAYNTLLFLHVLGAFGVLTAFALEWASLYSLQRSCSKGEMRESLQGFKILPLIGGPSYLIIVLSGIYLWAEAWRGSAWPVVAVISLVVVAVIGAVINGPRMAALGKAVEVGSDSDTLPEDVSSLSMLWGSLRTRTWMVIGITFLMTVKPGAIGSIVVMVISLLFGLIPSPLTFGHRSQNVCAVSPRT